MSTTETKIPPMTAAEYEAWVQPVRLRSQQELFDYQAETLAALNYLRYEHVDPFRELVPASGIFLLVPPRPAPFDFQALMANVVLDGEHGQSYISSSEVLDLEELPPRDRAYLCLDIEDGRAMLNRAPNDCREIFATQNRFGLRVFEGIIHVTLFPWVLKHHYVDLPGSRCGSGFVPDLYLGGERPVLGADWGAGADPDWGSASRGGILGL